MSAAADELGAQGWTVLRALRAPRAIDGLIASLDRLAAEVASPVLYSEEDLVLADDVKVSPVGLTFFGLLGRAPELAGLCVEMDLVALLHEVLGPALELEQVSGVISSDARPFFFWHHHLGGIDGQDFRGDRAQLPRPPERIERLVCTIYATALDHAHGQMLVHPRRVGDALRAPCPPGRAPWPSAIALDAPSGSVVVLDEATWHAVTPMTQPGLRHFFAFFVRRAGLPPNRRVDETIGAALRADPRLAAVFEPARAREGAARGRG